MMTGKKEIIKGQKYLKKNVMAKNLDTRDQNPEVGFEVLHYSVSEAQGTIEINVIKKQKSIDEFKIGVRTKDGEALAGEDYVAIDEPVVFSKNQTF